MALTKIVRVAFHLFFSPGRASNLAALRSDSLTKSPLQSHVTFGLGHACTWASKIRIEGSGCFNSGCSYILAGTLSSSSGFPPSIDKKIKLSIKKPLESIIQNPNVASESFYYLPKFSASVQSLSPISLTARTI